MRWTVLNALGAAAWLAGLTYAKSTNASADLLFGYDYHLLVGASIGFVGLAVLLWENIRSAN